MILATMSGAALFHWAWPILVFLGVCAILWWAIERLSLPQPARVVVIVLAALVGIYFLLTIGPPPG